MELIKNNQLFLLNLNIYYQIIAINTNLAIIKHMLKTAIKL